MSSITERSRAMPIEPPGKRVQAADKIQGVVVYRGELGIQWSRTLESYWTELRLPISEAKSLLQFLKRAEEDGRLK